MSRIIVMTFCCLMFLISCDKDNTITSENNWQDELLADPLLNDYQDAAYGFFSLVASGDIDSKGILSELEVHTSRSICDGGLDLSQYFGGELFVSNYCVFKSVESDMILKYPGLTLLSGEERHKLLVSSSLETRENDCLQQSAEVGHDVYQACLSFNAGTDEECLDDANAASLQYANEHC